MLPARLALVLALTSMPLLAKGQEPEPQVPGTKQLTFHHDGQERIYRIHLPPSHDAKKAVPLVFVFHGNGGLASGVERGFGFNPLADKHGLIAVYPQGIEKHWNDGRIAPRFANAVKIDDVGFIRGLIAQIEKNHRIDPNRIYATGFSNGGFFSHRLGWELSDKIAAIAPVSGTMGKDVAVNFAPKHPVHVLHIHGTKDAAVPYDGGSVGNQGGNCVSAPEMVAMWAKANGCKNKNAAETLLKMDEKSALTVRRESFTQGEKGVDVVLYTVDGLGHTWLRQPTIVEAKDSKAKNAAEVIWDFFEKHPKVKE